MNANELADVLEGMTTGWFVNDWKLLSDSATMLRQQQAEIEALKLQLHTTLTNRELRTYDGELK